MVESVFMVPALLVSLIYKEDETLVFLASIGITFVTGLLMSRVHIRKNKLSARDGMLIVSFSWILISVLVLCRHILVVRFQAMWMLFLKVFPVLLLLVLQFLRMWRFFPKVSFFGGA